MHNLTPGQRKNHINEEATHPIPCSKRVVEVMRYNDFKKSFIVPFVNHIVLFFLFAFNLFYSFTFLLFGRHALRVGSVERPARNHLRAPFSCRSMKTVSQVIPGVTQDFYFFIFEEKYLKKTQCVHSCQGKTKPRLVCIAHQEGSASVPYPVLMPRKNQAKVGLHRPSRGFRKHRIC